MILICPITGSAPVIINDDVKWCFSIAKITLFFLQELFDNDLLWNGTKFIFFFKIIHLFTYG